MSILDYYKPLNPTLPDPSGHLSSFIPPRAIAAANAEVGDQAETQPQRRKKRGKYIKYTPKERADIGRYAKLHGVSLASRVFSRRLGVSINECTVRSFKKSYEEESRKTTSSRVQELRLKRRGRPVVLGERLDEMVQRFILEIREKGGTVDTSVVVSAAHGIAKSVHRTQLAEYGGPAVLNKSWARSLLRRMNFTKRKGTTKSKISIEEFHKLKKQFLQDIVDTVTMEDIPPELIINWDQTGLNLVPASSWTMALKGSRRVEIKGMNDKRQITAIFCVSLFGDLLPVQLIYTGKTDRCHPPFAFPEDWLISHSPNHWSTEETMVEYIKAVINPYVNGVRARLGVGDDKAALAIFDHFKGQLTPKITQLLEANNIQSVLIPPGCTDRLQPLDVSVNRSVKSLLSKEFQGWYANEIADQLQSCTVEELEPIDLSTAKMKCLGAQWLVNVVDNLASSPDIIVNGFVASGITRSIEAGEPVMTDVSSEDENSTDEDAYEVDDNNEAYSEKEDD